MATTDEVVFAWAIGKTLLTVIVSLGILVYAGWAGAKKMPYGSEKQKPR